MLETQRPLQEKNDFRNSSIDFFFFNRCNIDIFLLKFISVFFKTQIHKKVNLETFFPWVREDLTCVLRRNKKNYI